MDQITDVRAAHGGRPASDYGVQRVMVTLSLSDKHAGTATLIRRPQTVISGELVDEQYMLIIPQSAQDDASLEAILEATPPVLQRLTTRATKDTSAVVPWSRKVTKGRYKNAVAYAKGTPVQEIPGLGSVQSFPLLLALPHR